MVGWYEKFLATENTEFTKAHVGALTVIRSI
jgi:hypothetical protein